MVDESLTLLSVYRVTDLASFGEAVRNELSRAQGAAAHVMSLCEGTAVLRLSHWSPEQFAAQLFGGKQLEGGELLSHELLAPERCQERESR